MTSQEVDRFFTDPFAKSGIQRRDPVFLVADGHLHRHRVEAGRVPLDQTGYTPLLMISQLCNLGLTARTVLPTPCSPYDRYRRDNVKAY